MPDEPQEKRPRTDDVDALCDGVRFVSLVPRRKPTQVMMECCWKAVFKCEFTEWEDSSTHGLADGMLMVRGVIFKKDNSTERVVLSFWPKSGKYRFQGKHAITHRHLERWKKEMDKLLGVDSTLPLLTSQS